MLSTTCQKLYQQNLFLRYLMSQTHQLSPNHKQTAASPRATEAPNRQTPLRGPCFEDQVLPQQPPTDSGPLSAKTERNQRAALLAQQKVWKTCHVGSDAVCCEFGKKDTLFWFFFFEGHLK